MKTVKFGTSGWRAIVADEFTFENVRLVAQAIADHMKAEGTAEMGIIIGYDARFMSEDFAEEAARVMCANEIRVFLCDRETPTPTIAYEILRKKTGGAINFTASHNPPEYNGIKFSPDWAGPALPETTNDIQERANELMENPRYEYEEDLEEAEKHGFFTYIDPRPFYLEELKTKINFDAIKKANLKIVIDPMYGAGRGYLDEALKQAGCEVKVLHNTRDVYFGGRPPEPSEENIPELIELMKTGDYDLGLAVDGDADRFGVVDKDGRFITPNHLIGLGLYHLLEKNDWDKGAARSVATTHLVDAVAKLKGVSLYETPVGFKFIGDYIAKDEIAIGGEESAGLSIRHHVPEKDGILACLLAAEMVAMTGKSLSQLLEELQEKVGYYYTQRINLHYDAEFKQNILDKLENPPEKFGDMAVDKLVEIDGKKFIFDDGSWFLLRLSGTEPVVRFYAEAFTQEDLEKLVELGKEFIYS